MTQGFTEQPINELTAPPPFQHSDTATKASLESLPDLSLSMWFSPAPVRESRPDRIVGEVVVARLLFNSLVALNFIITDFGQPVEQKLFKV